MKKVFEHIGVFFIGFGISFYFTQKCNDMFYKTVIKRENILSESDFTDSVIPKGLFSKGAKATFVKHKIEASQKDESIIYQNYIERKKNNIDERDQFKNDIFQAKNNSNSSSDEKI